MTEIPNKKGTLLIIDDEPDILWFVSKVCQPMGYETLTAGSGHEGLKMIRELSSKLDLVLLDLKMPGMGGLEVLRAIRKDWPDMPVIILTALHDKKEICENLGIEAFIKKPYSLQELYERIECVTERRGFDKQEVKLDADLEPCAKILIVDDELEVCETLAASLAEDTPSAHFETKWACSGDEALRVSVEFQPDIGVIDIKMPHMWGDELIKRFKAGEGCAPKDFIIYTAVTESEEVARAKRIGHKFLTKPANLDALLEAITKICVKHNLVKKKGS